MELIENEELEKRHDLIFSILHVLITLYPDTLKKEGFIIGDAMLYMKQEIEFYDEFKKQKQEKI